MMTLVGFGCKVVTFVCFADLSVMLLLLLVFGFWFIAFVGLIWSV